MATSLCKILGDGGKVDGEQRLSWREQQGKIMLFNLHIKVNVVNVGYVDDKGTSRLPLVGVRVCNGNKLNFVDFQLRFDARAASLSWNGWNLSDVTLGSFLLLVTTKNMDFPY